MKLVIKFFWVVLMGAMAMGLSGCVTDHFTEEDKAQASEQGRNAAQHYLDCHVPGAKVKSGTVREIWIDFNAYLSNYIIGTYTEDSVDYVYYYNTIDSLFFSSKNMPAAAKMANDVVVKAMSLPDTARVVTKVSMELPNFCSIQDNAPEIVQVEGDVVRENLILRADVVPLEMTSLAAYNHSKNAGCFYIQSTYHATKNMDLSKASHKQVEKQLQEMGLKIRELTLVKYRSDVTKSDANIKNDLIAERFRICKGVYDYERWEEIERPDYNIYGKVAEMISGHFHTHNLIKDISIKKEKLDNGAFRYIIRYTEENRVAKPRFYLLAKNDSELAKYDYRCNNAIYNPKDYYDEIKWRPLDSKYWSLGVFFSSTDATPIVTSSSN